MTALRVTAQALAIPLALVVAVVLQLAVVNRAPLPGGTAPDLVLLVTAAVALRAGPMTGMLAGFCGGLAVDIAPPAAHLAGEYALVFCLVGYACGRARNAVTYATGEQPLLTSLTLMALGAAAGEAGKAALGRLLSDPDVTGTAIRHVLPGAIIYDLLLCPFIFWLISRVLHRPAPERAPRPEFAQVATAFRGASSRAVGVVPKLRLVGSTPSQVRPAAHQEPRLRFASGHSAPSSRTYAAFSPAQIPRASGRAAKLNFNRHKPDIPTAAGPRPRTSPGKGWLRVRPPAAAPVLKRRPPPKGWLRVQRPAGSPSLTQGSPPNRWLRAERPAGAPVLRRRSPGKGWLRPAKPAARPRRATPGKRWLRPAKPAKLTWYARSPGTRWVRRSRSPWRQSPWRQRRRRLLALMGVRR